MQYTTFQLAMRDFKIQKQGLRECLKRILVDGEDPSIVRAELNISRSTVNTAKTNLLHNLQRQMKIANLKIIEEVVVDEEHYNIVETIHSICISPHITQKE